MTIQIKYLSGKQKPGVKTQLILEENSLFRLYLADINSDARNNQNRFKFTKREAA